LGSSYAERLVIPGFQGTQFGNHLNCGITN